MAISVAQFQPVQVSNTLESLMSEALREVAFTYVDKMHKLDVTGLTQEEATIIAREIGRVAGMLDAQDVQEDPRIAYPSFGYPSNGVPCWTELPRVKKFNREERNRIIKAAKRAYIKAFKTGMSN